MDKDKKNRKSNIKILLLNVLVMVVVIAVVVFVALNWIDNYTQHGKSVKVPRVKGLHISKVEEILKQSEIECVVADSIYNKEEANGTVMEIRPDEGSSVKEGRKVFVTVSSNKTPLMPVPDVVENSSYRQAMAKILAAGFNLTEDEVVEGNNDWIYGVKYNGRLISSGEKLPKGARLTLVVGNGRNVTEYKDSLTIKEETEGETDDNSSWF